MIIRSHGVGPAIYEEAEEKGLNIVDATCPHVKKAQQDAKSVIEDGMTLVIWVKKTILRSKALIYGRITKV